MCGVSECDRETSIREVLTAKMGRRNTGNKKVINTLTSNVSGSRVSPKTVTVYLLIIITPPLRSTPNCMLFLFFNKNLDIKNHNLGLQCSNFDWEIGCPVEKSYFYSKLTGDAISTST